MSVGQAAERHAVAAEHDRVELQVVTDFLDRRILQQRPQQRQRLLEDEARRRRADLRLAEQVGGGRGLARERDVTRAVAAGREGDAGNPCEHRRRRVGQHAQREPPGRTELLDQRPDAVLAGDQRIVLADGVRGRRVLHHQRPESHPGEVRERPLARGSAIAERLGIELDRHVDPDPRQLTALPRVGGVPEQPLAIPLVGDLAGVRQQLLERAVLRDQIVRALLADARYAFDVVDRVPHQCEDVDHLLRSDAELLLHAVGVEPGAVIARVVDLDPAVHQLEEILVAGDDRHLEAGGHGLDRQRADHVVRFVALGRDDRHAERFTGLVDPRNLLREIRRHRRAIGLVVGDHVVAEGAAGEIE